MRLWRAPAVDPSWPHMLGRRTVADPAPGRGPGQDRPAGRGQPGAVAPCGRAFGDLGAGRGARGDARPGAGAAGGGAYGAPRPPAVERVSVAAWTCLRRQEGLDAQLPHLVVGFAVRACGAADRAAGLYCGRGRFRAAARCAGRADPRGPCPAFTFRSSTPNAADTALTPRPTARAGACRNIMMP